MSEQKRSAEELVKRILQDPSLEAKVKADPLPVLSDLADKVVNELPLHPPLQWDAWIYRMVVGTLGLAVVLTVLGGIVLARGTTPIPDMLTAIGSAAVGALAGLIAPSPLSKQG